MTISECRTEMRSIINELREIEWKARHGFTGIGEQYCGDCIGKIADKYQNGVLTKLNGLTYPQLRELNNGR